MVLSKGDQRKTKNCKKCISPLISSTCPILNNKSDGESRPGFVNWDPFSAASIKATFHTPMTTLAKSNPFSICQISRLFSADILISLQCLFPTRSTPWQGADGQKLPDNYFFGHQNWTTLSASATRKEKKMKNIQFSFQWLVGQTEEPRERERKRGRER